MRDGPITGRDFEAEARQRRRHSRVIRNNAIVQRHRAWQQRMRALSACMVTRELDDRLRKPGS